jgi:DHA1 family tetracycline resistance protein-like MFS transporter
VGGILGLSASLNSLTRVISPLIGAFLLGQISPAAPGVVGAVLIVGVAIYTWFKILPVPDQDCDLEAESLEIVA